MISDLLIDSPAGVRWHCAHKLAGLAYKNGACEIA